MTRSIRDEIRNLCEKKEIPLHGVAGIARWEESCFDPPIPPSFYPQSIWPDTRAVIVIGLPIFLPVLLTTPSIWYHDLYHTVNELLDRYTYQLALYLTGKGYPSVPVTRDGYSGIEALERKPVAFFSHRHAAFLAGLGAFGINNMLLTEQFGPRVRFGSVLTTAPLPSDPLFREDLCTRCMTCVATCPAGALSGRNYPEERTDTRSCISHTRDLASRGVSPCGICITVCPVGEDQKQFEVNDVGIYETLEGNERFHDPREHVQRYGHR